MKKAILFCYHGSKDTRGRADTKKLTKIFKKKNIKAFIKYGYLQNAKPSISSQINLLLKKKIKKITIIPGMIFSGNHVKAHRNVQHSSQKLGKEGFFVGY